MWTYILGIFGLITKEECERRNKRYIYETFVYCERSTQHQFKYEKHMHEVIYKLADMAKVEVEHRLDSRGQLHIDIIPK